MISKVLIDTNIWVDVMLRRPLFVEDSYGVLMACVEDRITMVIAGTSLKDVFYWVQKSAGAQAAYKALEFVFRLADIAAVDTPVCKSAVELERPDYEDGIIAACAHAESVDAVISRDAEAFSDAGVKRFAPSEFLDKLGWQHVPSF